MKKQHYQVKFQPFPLSLSFFFFFSFGQTSVNTSISRAPGCADALNSTAGGLADRGVPGHNQRVQYNPSAVINRAIISKCICSADSSESKEPCTRHRQIK